MKTNPKRLSAPPAPAAVPPPTPHVLDRAYLEQQRDQLVALRDNSVAEVMAAQTKHARVEGALNYVASLLATQTKEQAPSSAKASEGKQDKPEEAKKA